MTGYADQRERASGLEALICDVIAKPFTVAEIKFAVAAALAKASDSGSTAQARQSGSDRKYRQLRVVISRADRDEGIHG